MTSQLSAALLAAAAGIHPDEAGTGLIVSHGAFLQLDGSDLVHGHRTAEIVVWSWCPRSLSSPALMSSAVTSRRWPRSADQRLMRGWTAVK